MSRIAIQRNFIYIDDSEENELKLLISTYFQIQNCTSYAFTGIYKLNFVLTKRVVRAPVWLIRFQILSKLKWVNIALVFINILPFKSFSLQNLINLQECEIHRTKD